MKLESFKTNLAASLRIDLSYVPAEPVPVAGRTVELIKRPTQVLVSTRFPGRKFFTLGYTADEDVDEALAHLLLRSETPNLANIRALRALLVDTPLAVNILNAIMRRPNTTFRRGDYFITEEAVASVVSMMLPAGTSNADVVAVYTRLHCRALDMLGLLSKGQTVHFYLEDESLVVSLEQLRRLHLVDRTRLALSDTLLRAKMRDIDLSNYKNATAVIAQRIADSFEAVAHALINVINASSMFEAAMYVLSMYYHAPEQLPPTVLDSTSLEPLTAIANLTEAAVTNPNYRPTGNPFEYTQALDAVRETISSLASITTIPLSTYAKYFRVAPAMDGQGLVRGAVVMLPLAQTSELRIVHAQQVSEHVTELAPMAQSFTAASSIAAALNKSALSINAVQGMVNIIADALTDAAGEPSFAEGERLEGVRLLTIGLTQSDIRYLGLARASQVHLVQYEGKYSYVYGVQRDPTIGVVPGAALGSLLFYEQPAAAIVYSIGRDEEPYEPLPQRTQALPSGLASPRVLGSISALDSEFLTANIQKPFQSTLTMATATGSTTATLNISLTGTLPDLEIQDVARLAAIMEPATRLELSRLLILLTAALGGNGEPMELVTRHRAIAWLTNLLSAFYDDAIISAVAYTSLVEAVQVGGIDGRALAPLARRAFYAALNGSALAAMTRLGAVDGRVIPEFVAAIPDDDVLLVLGDRLPTPDLRLLATFKRPMPGGR